MAGFLRGWLRGEPLERLLRATPTPAARWSSRATAARRRCRAGPSSALPRPRLAASARLRDDADARAPAPRRRRGCATGRELAVLAFDHRVAVRGARAPSSGGRRRRAHRPLQGAARRRRAARRGARRAAAPAFGVIVDDRYGEDVLPTLTGSGCWIARPVELPGLAAARLRGRRRRRRWRCAPGRPSTSPSAWSLSTRTTPAELRAAQLARLRRAAARPASRTDRELLLEVIPPREPASGDRHRWRARSTQIYAAGVRPDWWKLPPPGERRRLARASTRRSRATIRIAAASCCSASRRARTSAGARASRPRRRTPVCSGFAVGRSIFARRRRRPGSPAARATTRSSPTSPRATRGSSALWRGPARRRAATARIHAHRGHRMTHSAHRLHRHRHDGPRHGEEPARQGLPADASRSTATARASPTCSPPARSEANDAAPRSRAAPTSSSSASPARRRSRRSCYGADGLLAGARATA